MPFTKGDKIEVITKHTFSDAASYFSATVLRHDTAAGTLLIKYATLRSEENRKRVKEHVDEHRVRPAMPSELHRRFREGERVDVMYDGAWRFGKVVEIKEESVYSVEIEGEERERVDVEGWGLRVHREWVGGVWVPPLDYLLQVTSPEPSEEPRTLKLRIKFSGKQAEPKFCIGANVEVKHDKEGYEGSWFNAIIVESMGDDKFVIEYCPHKTDTNSEVLPEIVNAANVRPSPPEITRPNRYLHFEEVDVYINGAWWVGHISKVLDKNMYLVRLGSQNDVVIVDHSKVRTRQNWVDGTWVTSSLSEDQQSTRTETETECYEKQPKTPFGVRIWNTRSRRKSIRNTPNIELSKGTVVEVKSDEEGYHGSWYTAVIVGTTSKELYTVEYQTLKTEDESKLLKEETDVFHIRPCPPNIQRFDRFRLFERVDVWYNDGWWVGIITRVLEDSNYTVYFWTTNEELLFGHFTLRPHQEWLNGKFIADFMRPPPQLPLKPKPGKSKRGNGISPVEANLLLIGMKVEVRSDEEGYSGTWYPAVVLCNRGNGKFLVEYRTLKADDKPILLKEVVDCYYIRPGPVVTQRADPFNPLEEVEAWYNNAWWHSCVCEICKGSKYTVRIKSTDEVVEFQHFELRRYEDWAGWKMDAPSVEVFL